MNFAEKISNLRKENNMTQEQLSEVLGVSRQSVSRWESGIAFPETDKLLQLSRLFNCTLDYLLKDDVTDKQANTIETKETIVYKKQGKLNNILNIVFSIVLLALITLCVLLMVENNKLKSNSQNGEVIEETKDDLKNEEFYYEELNQSDNKLQFEKSIHNKINGYQIDYVCSNVSIKIYEEFKLYTSTENITITEIDEEGFVYLNNGYFRANVEGLYDFYIKLEVDKENNVTDLEVSTKRVGSAYRSANMYVIRDGREYRTEMNLYDEFDVVTGGPGEITYNFVWVTREAVQIEKSDLVYFTFDGQKYIPELGYYFEVVYKTYSKTESGILNNGNNTSSFKCVLVVRNGKIYMEYKSIWENF